MMGNKKSQTFKVLSLIEKISGKHFNLLSKLLKINL